ncbi:MULTISPECIES: hypothetical protein, partial [unclassified Mesorhizobium]|uniref:hypothetical protein n=1 Tax=unclassified Mesorhizobium TaxID=325217 RepID=UPI001AECA85A
MAHLSWFIVQWSQSILRLQRHKAVLACGLGKADSRPERSAEMIAKSLDSFNCRRTLSAGGADYVYFDLA